MSSLCFKSPASTALTSAQRLDQNCFKIFDLVPRSY
jgi:hypothetical protein